VFAHSVDVVDGGARVQQGLGDLAQLLQADACDRRGEQTGAAARNQCQQQIVLTQPCRHLQHPQGCGFAAPVGQRVAGFDHFDATGRQAVSIAGDDQTGQARLGRPMGLDGSGHAGGCLAATDHQGAAAWRCGQMRRQDGRGIGCGDGSVKRVQQQGARIHRVKWKNRCWIAALGFGAWPGKQNGQVFPAACAA